jgi:hypothetical protein
LNLTNASLDCVSATLLLNLTKFWKDVQIS